jgi:hypothetical protein
MLFATHINSKMVRKTLAEGDEYWSIEMVVQAQVEVMDSSTGSSGVAWFCA